MAEMRRIFSTEMKLRSSERSLAQILASTAEAIGYGIAALLAIWPLRLILADYKTNKSQADDANERGNGLHL